jgi:hypothetical protein
MLYSRGIALKSYVLCEIRPLANFRAKPEPFTLILNADNDLRSVARSENAVWRD